MRKCIDCRKEVHITYVDYHVTLAPRHNVYIRDARVYVCDDCGEQGVGIQAIEGFHKEVEKLPKNNPTPVYFAVDHKGTWFRLPERM